jgi:Ca2+-transporting ATPase
MAPAAPNDGLMVGPRELGSRSTATESNQLAPAAEPGVAAAHAMRATDVCGALGTDPEQGLSSPESSARLERDGPNRLPAPGRTSRLTLVARQLGSPMIGLLGVAALISVLAAQPLDAVVIAAIVALNAAIGYVQESRAETAALNLRRLLAPRATVVRDGRTSAIDAAGLVPGDVVLLRAGNRVSADGRLFHASDVEIDESSLTGESLPDSKRAEPPVAADTPLADRETMAFAGTTVVRGSARLVVTATGSRTQIGEAVATATSARPSATPLQERLTSFAALILRVVAALCLLLAALAWAYGEDLAEALRIGVALAVAAVPEGLPAVLTAALAIGVQRMAHRNAIVRRLPAVETLGSTTVICTDKTGTLTEGSMSLGRIYACGAEERALGLDPLGARERELLTAAGIACQQEPGPASVPDPATLVPTEAAIAAAFRGQAAGTPFPEGTVVTRVEPFDSKRKRMSVVVGTVGGGETSYVKGAPESVLPRLAVDRATRGALAERAGRWAHDGVRVLLVARRSLEGGEDPERELEPLGLVGLLDPTRREVAAAIATARRAGVRTALVTGDHPGTAVAVARQVGIMDDGSAPVLTGSELDAIGDAELEDRAHSVSVFARVAPAHKVRIVRALQRRGDVVAMTGDGVNDVPALEAAHIGVAMGRRGTDAARESADMILADDNYATIVAAIRRGRSIYDNVVRFVHFLLAANAGEVLVFTLAIVAGLPAPLTVVQILLVNLLTDGPPAIAIGVDPPRPGLMRRPPRPPREPLLASIRTELVVGGVTTGVAAFGAFLVGNADDTPTAQTMTFATLVAAQLAYVFAVRAEGWPPLAGRNSFLYVAVAGTAAIAALLLAVRPAHELFDLVSLSGWQLAVAAALAAIPFTTLVVLKVWLVGQRRR